MAATCIADRYEDKLLASELRCFALSLALDSAVARRTRHLIALKRGYDPAQPRDWHGRWTLGGERVAQMGRGALPRYVRQFPNASFRQLAELQATRLQADMPAQYARRFDPSWQPRPSLTETVEGEIARNRGEALDARLFILSRGYAMEAEPSGSIFYQSDGRLVGDYRSGDIRLLSESEFNAVVGRATYGSIRTTPSDTGYRGLWYERPDGALFGYRNSQGSG